MSIFKIAVGLVIGFVMLFFVLGVLRDGADNDITGVIFHLFFLILVGILTYVFLG
jgi:hypothetical protein